MPRRRHRRRSAFPWVRVSLAVLAAMLAGVYLGSRLGGGGDGPAPASAGEEVASPAPMSSGSEPAGSAAGAAPGGSGPTPEAEATPVARLALIVDDLGRSVAVVDRLAALGAPVTGAVLPFEPHTEEVARRLAAHGLEVLCHLPMEPSEPGVDPGPGALERAMGPESIRRATRRALDAVPGALGANNHMGSAFSADPVSMRPVLEVIAARGLLWVDSRTGADSVGYRLAGALGVPSAERDLFLDSASDGAGIEERWRELLERARAEGAAVAIGHPHDSTLTFLARAVPAAAETGFELVPVSYLVDRPGNLPP